MSYEETQYSNIKLHTRSYRFVQAVSISIKLPLSVQVPAGRAVAVRTAADGAPPAGRPGTTPHPHPRPASHFRYTPNNMHHSDTRYEPYACLASHKEGCNEEG